MRSVYVRDPEARGPYGILVLIQPNPMSDNMCTSESY